MKKSEIKKVDLTLMGKFNRMVGKGIFSLEIGFDALALGARAIRDLFFTAAGRAAKLADSEGDLGKVFDSVDRKVDKALRREISSPQAKLRRRPRKGH